MDELRPSPLADGEIAELYDLECAGGLVTRPLFPGLRPQPQLFQAALASDRVQLGVRSNGLLAVACCLGQWDAKNAVLSARLLVRYGTDPDLVAGAVGACMEQADRELGPRHLIFESILDFDRTPALQGLGPFVRHCGCLRDHVRISRAEYADAHVYISTRR
jgi:hypothetical protein